MRTFKLFSEVVSLIVLFSLTACGGGSSSSSSDDDGISPGVSTCSNIGPGVDPLSGSGTPSDPYIIKRNIKYGGCAVGEADPGPIYKISVPAGSYTVSQTNGTTDLELWIYDENGNLLDIIDDFFGGVDESRTFSVDSGAYGIEVFSNGSDGLFTLEIF